MSYFVYIYSPSDFVTAPPIEGGSAADGTAPFTLVLAAGAVPTIVEITDDDAVFDEVDATQSLTNSINLDGTTYAAGTTINTAYDLLNSATGHKITSFHFGGDGYQQGAVQGVVSTVELVAGTSYTFDSTRTSHTQNNQYTDYFACFAKGSMIDTAHGPVTIEDLSVGDMIVTLDHGLQPIRWIEGRKVRAVGNMAPVVFAKGAIGNTEELRVSPEHRMLIEDARAVVFR